MAVCCNLYGEDKIEYAGCVLGTYERNGYDDSDFYAICWDEEKQEVVDVEYDTTRSGGGGWAKVDATEETLRKAFRHFARIARISFDGRWNKEQAREVKPGDTVIVVRGKKIPKGTVATCFWVGERRNIYTYSDDKRVGVEVNGQRSFLPLEYVEVVDWQSRLIHGKERLYRIRKAAIRMMPIGCRHLFENCYFRGRYCSWV